MTGSAGVEVVPIAQAVARYRATVDAKNELDPDFVIMAQCYAGNASNSTFEDTLVRLKAYREVAGVDWVQLEYPRSTEEIRRARATVAGPLSFMKGGMGRHLSFKEHLELGVNIAWYPTLTHQVVWAALRHFMRDFQMRDIAAWDEFLAREAGDPCPNPLSVGPEGEGLVKQRILEERYFSGDMLAKYSKSP